MNAEDIKRRRAARSTNERLKLAATLLNNVSLALLTTAILGPIISTGLVAKPEYLFLAVACQLLAHLLLMTYKSED